MCLLEEIFFYNFVMNYELNDIYDELEEVYQENLIDSENDISIKKY